MNDLIIFQPESALFYTFGIIIPIILLLFSIGYLVFVIGEFKENNNILPNIILFLVTKLSILVLGMSAILHIVFDKSIISSNKVFVLMVSFWAVFIYIDTFLINGVLSKIDRFNKNIINIDKLILKTYIYKMLYNLITKNKYVFFMKYFFMSCYSICCLANLIFMNINYLFGHSITVIFAMYCYINYSIIKYYKRLKTKQK